LIIVILFQIAVVRQCNGLSYIFINNFFMLPLLSDMQYPATKHLPILLPKYIN